IADICMAYDNAAEIQECERRGNIIREKVTGVPEHRRYCTELKAKLGPKHEEQIATQTGKERAKFFKKMAKLSKDLTLKEELLEKYAATPARPIYAFVTFDKAAGRTACLGAFNDHPWIYNYFYGQHLKLGGKWIKVRESPEPSTILWENLAFGSWDCFKRRALTSVLAFGLIIFSLIMIFSARYLEQINAKSAAGLCPADFGDYSKAEQQAYVEDNEDMLGCYCDQLSTYQQGRDSLCRNYLRQSVQAQTFTYFASFVVLLVNVLIEYVLKALSSFEKHNSEDARGKSTFLRLFILKYINTSLVFFINNNNVLLEVFFGIATDSTTEFTADWFNTIGVTVILVQIGDVFSCHGDNLWKYYSFHRSKRLSRTTVIPLTQDELNQKHIGPPFEFAFSYAQLLSTFFCCFTFSTGIPILYFISMVNFGTYYMVEKYLFMHMYRVPPHLSNKTGKRASALLPYAFIIHLAMSIWVLSNDELFTNETTDDAGATNVSGGSPLFDKITGASTFPLFCLLVAILAIRLGTHVFKGSHNTVISLLEQCCGSKRSDDRKKHASAGSVVTYTRAVQRNMIKGLTTYNILQNPIYKERFAITWKFAMSHKDVREVRNMKAKAADKDDEGDAEQMEALQTHAGGQAC
ncbi:hypothetical protein B484DRAFT_400519, partial [Ochromonadaceae sp. CCMP2298]